MLGATLLAGHWLTHTLKIGCSRGLVRNPIGMLGGAVLQVFPDADVRQFKQQVVGFSPSLFFCVLLPPIIFASGYHMKGSSSSTWKIPCLVVIGTFVSAWIVGFLLVGR